MSGINYDGFTGDFGLLSRIYNAVLSIEKDGLEEWKKHADFPDPDGLGCLYQKLKDEIADLDEKIMDNLFFFRISASDCNEHDTLFYLKSLDLDRRMGYELGTIYECTHEN